MIKSIEMTNWRAYERYTLRFQSGLTFLMGPNGIGKTSVLEAIAYAMTGETATIPPKERSKLLRDPNKPATVMLTFEVDGNSYIIERSQSPQRADAARLMRSGTDKPLASTQASVSDHVARLMGTSADFLRRILYMSEGDVFQFLKDPPSEALNLQIRRVFGLVQLDEFSVSLVRAEKDVKNKMEAVQEALRTTEEGGAARDLEGRLAQCRTERAQILQNLRAHQEELTSLRLQQAQLEKFIAEFEEHEKLLAKLEAEYWHLSSEVSGGGNEHDQIRAGVLRQRDQLAALQHELGRAEGERSAYSRTLEILGLQIRSSETLPCPVCGKPIAPHERQAIWQHLNRSIQQAEQESSRIKQGIADARDRCDRMEAIERRLRALEESIARSRQMLPGIGAKTPDAMRLRAELRQRLQQMNMEEAKLREIEQQLDTQESAMASYMMTRDRLRSLGYESVEAARNGLVDLETRSLTLRAARKAAEATRASQRDMDMVPVYEQIASIWNVFMPGDEWTVNFDPKGMPLLRNSLGRELSLNQFSGGEKTALLVMLHTVLAHHFAHSSFLLIDEPLEHLDAVNRRSLIYFLVSACHRGLFKQAIVTTYEESLTRKYLSDPMVHVVHI